MLARPFAQIGRLPPARFGFGAELKKQKRPPRLASPHFQVTRRLKPILLRTATIASEPRWIGETIVTPNSTISANTAAIATATAGVCKRKQDPMYFSITLLNLLNLITLFVISHASQSKPYWILQIHTTLRHRWLAVATGTSGPASS